MSEHLSVDPSDPPARTERLRIEPWPDPVLDQLGHDPRSAYVEQFWLPILGPSSIWLLRRTAVAFDAHPDGTSIEPVELAGELGLGAGAGRHSPVMRTIDRCCRFSLASQSCEVLRVRRRLPPLTRGQLERLSAPLRHRHDKLLDDATDHRLREAKSARARRLALTLLEVGESPIAVERHLHLWRYEPDIARAAATWAVERHIAAAEAAGIGDTAA